MPQIPLGDIERHFWLTRSVARSMGVSFTEAMVQGKVTENDYAEVVTRCRAADCSEKCQHWLATQNCSARTAPEFCVNADLLNRLR
ncbi:DUF6455 family protein [Ruegeria sp. WL0004]|uniref:DUF6455 family protein n=1 Tax=Ruegeria marisflavi TaxID=2984152 RepID=A0ABT2WTM4_9RHOB|nr:DUF6455 family protein [Ruegeria sp. WL0004]MCU9839254.1 DUF6455 family protein [Ruegeria sp. WL0004]